MGHLGPELALGGSSEALKFQMGLEAKIGPQAKMRPCKFWMGPHSSGGSDWDYQVFK